MKKAMILRGGWPGHDPVETTDRFAGMLRAHDFDVQIYDSLEPLGDLDALLSLDLIVISYTMSSIDPAYTRNVSKAVASGVGLADMAKAIQTGRVARCAVQQTYHVLEVMEGFAAAM